MLMLTSWYECKCTGVSAGMSVCVCGRGMRAPKVSVLNTVRYVCVHVSCGCVCVCPNIWSTLCVHVCVCVCVWGSTRVVCVRQPCVQKDDNFACVIERVWCAVVYVRVCPKVKIWFFL